MLWVFVLIELDEVPVIPRRFGHGLVRVVEIGLREAVTVPFEAGDFAGFAADAGGGVDQFANVVVAAGTGSRDRTSVP